MSLVVYDDVSLSLGGKPIVDALRLRVADGDRIGLIGPNGAGKSTLLRLATAEQRPDGGAVHRRRGLRLGHLPQDVTVEGGQPLLDFVVGSVPGRKELERELSETQQTLERARTEDDDSEQRAEQLLELGGRVAELGERLAHFDTEYSPHRAERILSGLGFQDADFGRDLGELSGGWRMRALLGALLFQRPDLLLLDEPTNHLDLPSVAWLSDFLRRYDRAFVLISHDREFLNEQVERIVSFEPEGIRTFTGNYEQYVRQREQELEILQARAKNLERERAHAQRFIDRFRAKASKASQVQSRIKQLDKMETLELPERRSGMSFRFPPCERPGREVLRAEGLAKAFGAKRVFDGVDAHIERGERIAIIGVNGAGKTTLLRIVAGELSADAGTVSYGYRVKLGYYAQHHAEALPKRASAYDAVAERCADGSRERVRASLGALQMRDDDVDKPVGVLSGGERARVALARLLVDPGNLLLMDEPTNHLDLDSSESLAEAMSSYDGTLVFVSHNRHFLRRLATKIWHLDGGGLHVYPGSLDDYMASARMRLEGDTAARAVEAAVLGAEAPARGGDGAPIDAQGKRDRSSAKERKRLEAQRRNERHRRLSPLKRKIAELEARISTLERAQAERTERLADPALYEDAAERDAVLAEHSRAAAELEVLTAEWMEASEQLERAEEELSGEG